MEREKSLLQDHLTKKQEEPKLFSNGNENLPRMLDEIDVKNVSEKEKCAFMLGHHTSEWVDCRNNNFQHVLKVSNVDIGNDPIGSLVEASNSSRSDDLSHCNVEMQRDSNFVERHYRFLIPIAENVPDFWNLGRSFGLQNYEIENIAFGYSWEKSHAVLVKFLQNRSDSRDIPWSFFREKLSLFEGGVMAIKRLETRNPSLFNPPQENDAIISHLSKQKRNNGCGVVTFSHFYDINQDLKRLKKTSGEVNIDFGRNGNKNNWRFSEVQFLKEVNKHFRKQSELLKSNVYSAIPNEGCKILLMLEQFFTETEGFAFKGIDFEKHYSYFGKRKKVVRCDINWSNRICFYFKQSNMLVHIGFANQSNIKQVMNSNIHVIQFAESTYKSIQDSSLIHVGVVVCSDDIPKEDYRNCKKCLFNCLLVSRQDFENLHSFKNWIKNICKHPSILQHQKECRENNGFAKQFKEELFGYQSIYDNQFPPIKPTFD